MPAAGSVLVITGAHSEAVALWALRIRVCDLLVKPVSSGELSQRLTALVELTRQAGRGPARDIRFPPQGSEATALAKEVAYAVGFNDLSYFTWAFKRQLGLTPSEYRAGAR